MTYVGVVGSVASSSLLKLDQQSVGRRVAGLGKILSKCICVFCTSDNVSPNMKK